MDSLIDPGNTWLLWCVVTAVAAAGLWAETTRIGLKISGAVVALLSGLILSNVGILPAQAPVYSNVLSYGLPLAIPLLLFQADIKRIVRESGRVLVGFSLGAAGTLVGGLLSFHVLPLGESAGNLVASICAAYIGGTLNFVATADAIGLDTDATAAGIAAANLVVVMYLVVLFLLPSVGAVRRWFTASTSIAPRRQVAPRPENGSVSDSALALTYSIAISSAICAAGFALEHFVKLPGVAILSITFLAVAVATAFPGFFGQLQVAGKLGAVILQVFFATIGASASVHEVIEFGPTLLALAAFVLFFHFLFVIIGSRLAALSLDEALIASNSCAAGAPTAAAMAVSLRKQDLILPGILCGTLGYAIGTFAGISLASIIG